MTAQTDIPALESLEYLPYLDENGFVPESLQKKIGVYAIFDQERSLQLVAYSRDLHASLRQHLARCPDRCRWVKLKTIDRPSRSALESIRDAWFAENGTIPPGNDAERARWNDPIDAKPAMTEDEKARHDRSEAAERAKLLKTVARRVEADIQQALEARGAREKFRFNPKLKEQGLLDLVS